MSLKIDDFHESNPFAHSVRIPMQPNLGRATFRTHVLNKVEQSLFQQVLVVWRFE